MLDWIRRGGIRANSLKELHSMLDKEYVCIYELDYTYYGIQGPRWLEDFEEKNGFIGVRHFIDDGMNRLGTELYARGAEGGLIIPLSDF